MGASSLVFFPEVSSSGDRERRPKQHANDKNNGSFKQDYGANFARSSFLSTRNSCIFSSLPVRRCGWMYVVSLVCVVAAENLVRSHEETNAVFCWGLGALLLTVHIEIRSPLSAEGQLVSTGPFGCPLAFIAGVSPDKASVQIKHLPHKNVMLWGQARAVGPPTTLRQNFKNDLQAAGLRAPPTEPSNTRRGEGPPSHTGRRPRNVRKGGKRRGARRASSPPAAFKKYSPQTLPLASVFCCVCVR